MAQPDTPLSCSVILVMHQRVFVLKYRRGELHFGATGGQTLWLSACHGHMGMGTRSGCWPPKAHLELTGRENSPRDICSHVLDVSAVPRYMGSFSQLAHPHISTETSGITEYMFLGVKPRCQ